MADAVKMARDAIGLKGITYEDKEKKVSRGKFYK